MLGVNDSTNTLLESSNTFQKFSYPTDLIKGRKKCFHRVRNPELNDFNYRFFSKKPSPNTFSLDSRVQHKP